MGQPVVSQALETQTVTIANGASLSGSVDLGGRKLCAIIMPAAWTSAAITFQASMDGSTFYDVYDAAVERNVSVGASYYSALAIADYIGIRHLKLRSGTSGSAVNQSADRVITLVLQP
tara:strand:- start:99 stop:452 length:354 start_codon:yes stop_codon:yes gene_type:complete